MGFEVNLCLLRWALFTFKLVSTLLKGTNEVRMLRFIIITLSLGFTFSAMAADLPPQKECFRYTYLKSSMNETNAKKSCEKIDNKYSLACSKMALAYLGRGDQMGLLESCAKIKSDKSLTCVIKKAMQAKSQHVEQISKCS